MSDMPTCTRCARDLRDDELSRFLCRICEDRTAAALVAIPALYSQLSQHLQRGAATGPAVSGSKTAPLPLRIDVLDAQMETGPILGPLQAWVRDWEYRGHAELAETGPLQERVAGACRTLRYNLGWAVEHHAAADEFANEVAAMHRTLQGMTGGERPARLITVTCPCQQVIRITLNVRDVTCPACRTEYGHAEVLRLPLAERRAA